ncbi:MFS transporter [Kitasatospora sp. GAS204B]|uniref:MFS transporter n=1 Tax=unclassified Kitasatospora TaxID=2633591 RepID=UPI0024770D82|nr:MFS transporter [Kitasatospora sp. GAS204B]MDH6122409.1 putative MFS family arabinose efflux permease [Kitasatospora sp. GAS204B]
MRHLLTDRNIRLYLAGQCLSVLGDFALWLAVAIWVKMLTSSASAAGLCILMLSLGSLASPLTGALVDRTRRRPLLIIVNTTTAVLVLTLLLVHRPSQVWLIDTVMFGYGISGAILTPAQAALLQAIVPEELLGAANSMLQTMQWGMRVITPLLGAGLLAGFGPVPVIIGDATSFVVAGTTLVALRTCEDLPTPSSGHQLAEAAAGARHILQTPALRQCTAAAALAMGAFGLAEPTIFAVVSQGLHRPDAFLGVLVSFQGAGSIAAGANAAHLLRRLNETRLTTAGLACAAVGFLLEAVPSIPAALTGCAFIGASLPWITVGITTLFQRRTPPHLMGRTTAALNLALSLPDTTAVALAAALITALDFRILLLIIAALVTLAAAYLSTRGVNHHLTHAPCQ